MDDEHEPFFKSLFSPFRILMVAIVIAIIAILATLYFFGIKSAVVALAGISVAFHLSFGENADQIREAIQYGPYLRSEDPGPEEELSIAEYQARLRLYLYLRYAISVLTLTATAVVVFLF